MQNTKRKTADENGITTYFQREAQIISLPLKQGQAVRIAETPVHRTAREQFLIQAAMLEENLKNNPPIQKSDLVKTHQLMPVVSETHKQQAARQEEGIFSRYWLGWK